jgi:hypothetical protein
MACSLSTNAASITFMALFVAPAVWSEAWEIGSSIPVGSNLGAVES